jgi:2-dehydropantoate 2-reductase
MRSYTVVGAGAIGGTIGAHLHLGGSNVLLVDSDREHVRRIQQRGLEIRRPDGSLHVPVPATTPENAPQELGAVLLAVKAPATDDVARWIAPRLRRSGWVASMQNGLLEPTIAAHVGSARTVSAFVDLFADVVEPGVVLDGGAGAIALGEYIGGVSLRVRTLAYDLQHWGTPILTDNVDGYLWSKLGFAAMLAASALVDDDMGALIDRHRRGMHALVREILGVAAATRIRLEGFDAFSPGSYLADPDAADRATDALVQWLSTQSKKRSGYWRDLAVHRRRTEVGVQFRAVTDAAARSGVDVPLTRWLIETIAQIEDGSRTMTESNLDELDRLATP